MQPNRYSRMGSEIDVIQCYGGPSVALGVEMSADTMSLTAWNETRENPKTNIMLTIGGKFLNILSHPILSYPILSYPDISDEFMAHRGISHAKHIQLYHQKLEMCLIIYCQKKLRT